MKSIWRLCLWATAQGDHTKPEGKAQPRLGWSKPGRARTGHLRKQRSRVKRASEGFGALEEKQHHRD